MEGQQIASREPETKDDGVLLSEGRAALRERLGVLGSLRFLRLISGQSDRFEDLRKEWEDLSEEELFAKPKPEPSVQR